MQTKFRNLLNKTRQKPEYQAKDIDGEDPIPESPVIVETPLGEFEINSVSWNEDE